MELVLAKSCSDNSYVRRYGNTASVACTVPPKKKLATETKDDAAQYTTLDYLFKMI
jgi:hypothetical protein